MSDTIPFTYLIGWSKLQKYYYGVRYAVGCHPNDLWTKYFTSSKVVAEYRIKYGEPDIIQIRKKFLIAEQATNWEFRVLSKIKVIRSNTWLNQAVGQNSVSLYKTEEHKKNIAIANSKPKSGNAKIAAMNNLKKAIESNTGKKRPEHSKIMKKKMRQLHDDKIIIPLTGEAHPMYGKTHTVEAKSKIIQSIKHRPKMSCIKCHKPRDGIHNGIWTCHFLNHHKNC